MIVEFVIEVGSRWVLRERSCSSAYHRRLPDLRSLARVVSLYLLLHLLLFNATRPEARPRLVSVVADDGDVIAELAVDRVHAVRALRG